MTWDTANPVIGVGCRGRAPASMFRQRRARNVLGSARPKSTEGRRPGTRACGEVPSGVLFFVARGDNNCYLGAPHRNIFKHIRSRYFGVPDGH